MTSFAVSFRVHAKNGLRHRAFVWRVDLVCDLDLRALLFGHSLLV